MEVRRGGESKLDLSHSGEVSWRWHDRYDVPYRRRGVDADSYVLWKSKGRRDVRCPSTVQLDLPKSRSIIDSYLIVKVADRMPSYGTVGCGSCPFSFSSRRCLVTPRCGKQDGAGFLQLVSDGHVPKSAGLKAVAWGGACLPTPPAAFDTGKRQVPVILDVADVSEKTGNLLQYRAIAIQLTE